MKQLYNKIISGLTRLPLKLHLLKTFVAEYVAIYKKRKLYKDIEWTKEQQQEFDFFWKNNYGQKISNRWHKLYESISGVHNKEYFPEILFTTKIEPLFNPFTISNTLQDKSFVEILLGEYSEHFCTPKTHVIQCSGIFYNSFRDVISQDEAIKYLKNVGNAVIKISIDSSSGKGVEMVNFGCEQLSSEQDIKNLFERFGKNFIIQERVEQNSTISKIYNKSLNTFRVITYILNGRVYHTPTSMRIGSGGGVVDNIHAGGLVIGVSEDGHLEDKAYRLGYCDRDDKLVSHPDSGLLFKDVSFDFIPTLHKELEHLHGRLPHIGIISWDIALNSSNKFVVLEVNLLNQSSWFPQVITGKSLFGENTKDVLNLICKVNI